MVAASCTRRESGKIGAGCVITVVVVLVAIGVIVYFVGKAGLDLVAEQVKQAVRDNPVVLEHVGNIESITLDLKATGAAGGKDVFVFQVAGPKGKGELSVRMETTGDETRIREGTLRTPDGQTHDLFPAGG